LVAALAVWPFVAQAQSAGSRCLTIDREAPAEARISECTAAIESGAWSGRMLGFALARRGDAHAMKRDYDRAIADYTEAMRAYAKYPWTFYRRARTYAAMQDYDRAIADYGEAIRLFPENAFAFIGRGSAYGVKGDTDRAIADFTEAIRLAPENAFAHMRRGFIHHLKGENGRAVADLSEAIRLKPDNSGAHFYRGITYLYDNSLADAVADFNRANELDPKRPYGALWHDIAARRHAAPSRLSEAALHLDMGKWPAPVIRLFLDQTTPDSAIAAADDPDPMTKQDQLCEAHFYSGVHALRRDAKAEAVRLLRIAAQDCPKKLIEGHAAQLELKMLGATP